MKATDFSLTDYETLEWAMSDYIDTVDQQLHTVRKHLKKAGVEDVEHSEPVMQWKTEWDRARAIKRKIVRRAGRLRKLEAGEQVPELVYGEYFCIDGGKLVQVFNILARSGLACSLIQSYLLDEDRRTSDDKHQRFLDESSAEDIAEWTLFTLGVD